MADLTILSPVAGADPTLGAHLTTKTYVDGRTAVRVTTSSTRATGYTIVAGDVGAAQIYSSSTAGTFTLPTNASQAIAVGSAIPFRQASTGQLTIAAASGVTLRARGSAFKLAGQYAVAEAVKVATDEWWLYGDITT